MEAKKMKEKILSWFATGEVGASSKAMASCIAGVNGGNSHPSDPSDLNRCLLFLEAVPEARDHMDKLRSLSPTWAALVDRWEEVEASFLTEAGRDWSKARSAPKTYELMKAIRC